MLHEKASSIFSQLVMFAVISGVCFALYLSSCSEKNYVGGGFPSDHLEKWVSTSEAALKTELGISAVKYRSSTAKSYTKSGDENSTSLEDLIKTGETLPHLNNTRNVKENLTPLEEHEKTLRHPPIKSRRFGLKKFNDTFNDSHASLEKSETLEHPEMSKNQKEIVNSIGKLPLTTANSFTASAGYILSLNYYEQQTMGSRNMLQLQCLARRLGAVVVKPLVQDSSLKTPLSDATQKTSLQFEDFFDLDEWLAFTNKAAYAPLVKWEAFTKNAPRDVILVQFKYRSVADVMNPNTSSFVSSNSQGERYHTGCTEKWPSKPELAFLGSKNFKIVRKVCFNFYYGNMLTFEQFTGHMLGGYSSTNVTIIMDMWRGLGSGQRVLVEDTCVSIYPVHEYIHPSQRLIRDAESYIQVTLKGLPFVAVMGRLEMSLLTVRKEKSSMMQQCLKETVAELTDFKKKADAKEAFLSIDIGKYGTKKWRSKTDSEMTTYLEEFLVSVYGKPVSVKEWEATFENVSSSVDAGYVGLLQKVIVTRARCILFIGGGAFQRHALNLYRQKMKAKSDECLGILRSCTSSKKLAL